MREGEPIMKDCYFDSSCGQTFHYFLRDDEEGLLAFHFDDSECKASEFQLPELDAEKFCECPQCGKRPADHGHIKVCIGYKKPYSADEIRDAYSHPTERAKRDSLLAGMERLQ